MLENKHFMSRYGYPILLGVYSLAALILFAWTLRFITVNINAALDINAVQSGVTHLEIDSANFATRHLGVSQVPLVDNTQLQKPAETEQAPPQGQAVPALQPSSVSVRVLNSTTVSGLALRLQDTLRKAGFTQISAGNSNSPLETTEIRMKPGAEALRSQIEALVKNDYVLGAPVTLGPDAAQDVIIVIGRKKP